jgi:hypothetical protein
METSLPATSYEVLMSVDESRNHNAPRRIDSLEMRHQAGNIEVSTNGENFSTPDEEIHIPKPTRRIHLSIFYKYHAHLLLPKRVIGLICLSNSRSLRTRSPASRLFFGGSARHFLFHPGTPSAREHAESK